MKLRIAAAVATGLALAAFVACADSDDAAAPPVAEAGTPETGAPDTAAPDADAGEAEAAVDAAALRCSGETCLVDLPNPASFGLSAWMFAGVYADPVSGVWAVANGADTDEGATAQLLHLEGNAWKVQQAVTLGATGRSVRLTAIAGDGKGIFLAVGRAVDDEAGVLLRGDGTTFTVSTLGTDLRAAWVAAPNDAYVVGGGSAVFHSAADGGWIDEGKAPADLGAVWGNGSGDVYVAGSLAGEFQDDGYLGHRTALPDGGARKWAYSTFPSAQQPIATSRITGGVAGAPGKSWWAAPELFGSTTIVARLGLDAGKEVWTRDTFAPHVDLRAFWAQSESDLWAVGGLGRLYHHDGAAWKDAFLVFNGAPLTANLTGVSGLATGELFIVGEGVALRRKPK